MDEQKAIEKLKCQLKKATELRQRRYDCQEFKEWKRDTVVALKKIFKGDNGSHAKEFEKISYSPMMFTLGGGDAPFHRAHTSGLDSAEAKLKSMIKELEDWGIGEDDPSSRIESAATPILSDSRKVFVVHGHDEAAKLALARFIEKLDLTPVILHEKPNEGRTIIEKFEDHVDVGFAVVLMTPDDVGALAKEKDKLKPRARQNVILELGFFLGKLGRKHVCALYKENVEIPSDYKGVLFIPMDKNNGWQLSLAREIKAAGIEIDLNKAI